MNKPIFIKLGGSILTDKRQSEALDHATLNSIATTLAAVRDQRPATPLLIGHGGGSFGHYWAQRYATQRGIVDPQSWWGVVRVADAMARLNRAVVAVLIDAGIPAFSIQPSASARATGGTLVSIDHSIIMSALQAGLVPVVYGDVVFDKQQGCAIISTEALFTLLAESLQPCRIVLVGEQGVYEADPRRTPDARLIPHINRSNYEQILGQLGSSHGVDVTGGMRAKVEAMWQLASGSPGLEIIICGPHALAAAVDGSAETATTITYS